MSDPRQLQVSKTSAKKTEVVDRTKSERKYCAIDQFYYSEMFSCPICYGVEQERERIIKLLSTNLRHVDWEGIFWEPETTGKTHSVDVEDIIKLIKGEAE